MGLFGQLVKTVVNVAILPVTLPVAILKDADDHMSGKPDGGWHTKKLIQQIKDDADDR